MNQWTVPEYPEPGFQLDQPVQAAVTAKARFRATKIMPPLLLIIMASLALSFIGGLNDVVWLLVSGFVVMMLSFAGLILNAFWPIGKCCCSACSKRLEAKHFYIPGGRYKFLICPDCRRYAFTYHVTD